jgi:hypothetical protein
VLLAPGQPGLRVNVTPDEVLRYSPKKADVIDVETGEFVTVPLEQILAEHGDEYPQAARMLSVLAEGHLRRPTGTHVDTKADQVVVIRGARYRTPFAAVKDASTRSSAKWRRPISSSPPRRRRSIYAVPPGLAGDAQPSPIPRNLPRKSVLFTANRFVSNGRVPDITHIVYVDPDAYNELGTPDALRSVGRAVGRLNKLLPKRQFVLLGPGRWGSRGDIKLGVSVSYSDISNTSLLVEMARQKGNYLPDLSFGTHFFQDLVEASIRYLPLYPDDPSVEFDSLFLKREENILASLLPEFSHLADVVHVIDVARVTDGKVLRVLLNADLDEAVGFFAEPQVSALDLTEESGRREPTSDLHWRWRSHMAERIAAHLDPVRFGVERVFLIGSAKNATSGPASDIDLIVHVNGTPEQRGALEEWLSGWSVALSESNYLRTCYKTYGMLDVLYLTELVAFVVAKVLQGASTAKLAAVAPVEGNGEEV